MKFRDEEDLLTFKPESLKGQNFLQDIEHGSIKSSVSPVCTTWSGVAELAPHLYLSGAAAATPATLQALGVTCVVNCAAELPTTPTPSDDVRCVRVNLLDTPSTDILEHLDELGNLIQQEAANHGRTLVHCVAGVSRSSALCIGYLMRAHRRSLKDCFFHVRERRPSIRPNCGFFRQLIDYERRLFGTTSVSMVYNQVTCSEIPDVYEADYYNTLHYNRRFGRN